MNAPWLQPAYLALTNRQMEAPPPSSKRSASSQGPLWPRASGFSQDMHLPASTPRVFDQVHLTHTTASEENPSKHCNMLSRHARYTTKHGGNSSYRSQMPCQSHSYSVRRKEVRPCGVSCSIAGLHETGEVQEPAK